MVSLTGVAGTGGSGTPAAVGGDGITPGTSSSGLVTGCAVFEARGSGYNFSAAGLGGTVERCVAAQCAVNGFFGNTNNATRILLNESSENTGNNYLSLGTASANNPSGISVIAATINYGANLGA